MWTSAQNNCEISSRSGDLVQLVSRGGTPSPAPIDQGFLFGRPCITNGFCRNNILKRFPNRIFKTRTCSYIGTRRVLGATSRSTITQYDRALSKSESHSTFWARTAFSRRLKSQTPQQTRPILDTIHFIRVQITIFLIDKSVQKCLR